MRGTEKKEFLGRAKEAALWMLEREENAPKMTWFGDRVHFTVDGLSFEYRPHGHYAEDNPCRLENQRTIEHDEGLVLIAKCPRHGDTRYSEIIPTLPLSWAGVIGKLIGCSLCSEKTVVIRQPGDLHARGGYVFPQNLCAKCAERRFKIPKSCWLSKSPRYAEEEFRGPTRRALAQNKLWAQDVECDQCVTLVCASGGGGLDTHASLRRTYKR